MKPIILLYFGGWTLQKKAQTPLKIRVIWIPGTYEQRSKPLWHSIILIRL